MTVKEMIKELERIDNKDLEVVVYDNGHDTFREVSDVYTSIEGFNKDNSFIIGKCIRFN